MRSQGVVVFALSAIAGLAQADNLCRTNPFTRGDAEAGKVAFNSHCALCHQYNMSGRQPGNTANESPDFKLLSDSDVQFVDGAGGVVPPLLGTKFFGKQQGKSFTEFTAFVSSAANTFPPQMKVEMPKTYLQIAAYVLYRNCGKM